MRTAGGIIGPEHHLGARARGILQAASPARHNLEPDQVEAINELLAPTGTTFDQLLTEQQPHYAADSDTALIRRYEQRIAAVAIEIAPELADSELHR